MNEFKKELIKKELKNATSEELREIFEYLKYKENYEKVLKEEIEKRKKENEDYDKMLKSEIITITAYS